MSAQPAIDRLWLHDDEEEDLVGSDWHQRAIVGVFDALQDVAEDAGLTWHVGNQHTLVARLPDGRTWRPCPDIMVHPRAGSASREEMVVSVDGPPALVIEVLSPTTWRYDRDEVQGKGAGYMAIGVDEYLLFDPLGSYLDPPCRAWRQRNGIVEDWLPEPDGRYRSASLGVAFRPEGESLRTYGLTGEPVSTHDERRREIARLRADRERQSQETVQLRADQKRQTQEIARLRTEYERLRRRVEGQGAGQPPESDAGSQ